MADGWLTGSDGVFRKSRVLGLRVGFDGSTFFYSVDTGSGLVRIGTASTQALAVSAALSYAENTIGLEDIGVDVGSLAIDFPTYVSTPE